MEFITFKQVERFYRVGTAVIRTVDRISFAPRRGTFNVVLGQSGAWARAARPEGARTRKRKRGLHEFYCI